MDRTKPAADRLSRNRGDSEYAMVSGFPKFTITLAIALFWLMGVAAAQTHRTDSAAAPALELSAGQKQTIYESVSATQKNSPAPPGFRATVGARVPNTIELRPVPATIAALIPETAGHEVAMVEKEVVLVDPNSKRVVAVVVGQ
jgi:hypothetical protein